MFSYFGQKFFEASERDKNIVCTYKATVVDGTVGIRDKEWWLQRTVGPVCVLKHRQFSGHDNPVFTKHRVKVMKATRRTAKRNAQDVSSAMVDAASSQNATVSCDTKCWLGLPLNCRTSKRHTVVRFKFHFSLPQVRISYLLSINHFYQMTGRNNYFDRTLEIYTQTFENALAQKDLIILYGRLRAVRSSHGVQILLDYSGKRTLSSVKASRLWHWRIDAENGTKKKKIKRL